MSPDESTTQALRRLGYHRVDHERGGELCRRLREISRQGGSAGVSCHGRHVERIADCEHVWELGCSASTETANAWIERMERELEDAEVEREAQAYWSGRFDGLDDIYFPGEG